MKQILLILMVLIVFSCDEEKKVKIGNEIIELKNFSFVKGKHCEFTSIINALNYQGVFLSEAMINGLVASPGFIYVEDGDFPFIGGRIDDIKRNLQENTGIEIIDKYPDTNQNAYDEVKNILKQNIPVILQLNMRYLPYRWNGKYGEKYMSFGSHYVTLVKLDEIKGFAYVTDTDVKEIQKVKITDLIKARFSEEGNKSLIPNNHYYYFKIPSNFKIDYRKSFLKSLNIMIKNADGNNGYLKNLSKFSNDIKNIEKNIKSKYMLKPLFLTFYGWIENFGTGGSAFRNFYRDYLIETGEKLKDQDIINLSLEVDKSCKKWEQLAIKFKNISEIIDKYYNDEKQRNKLYNEVEIIAIELYKTEFSMIESFKIYINKDKNK